MRLICVQLGACCLGVLLQPASKMLELLYKLLLDCFRSPWFGLVCPMWSLFDLHKDPHQHQSDSLLTRAPGTTWLSHLKFLMVKVKCLPCAATPTSELRSHGTLSLENCWRLLTPRSKKQSQNIIMMTNGRLPGRSFECLSALAEINLVSIHFSPGKQIRVALLFATLKVRHVRAQLEWKSHFKLVPVACATADIDTQATSRCAATEQVR